MHEVAGNVDGVADFQGRQLTQQLTEHGTRRTTVRGDNGRGSFAGNVTGGGLIQTTV